MESSPTKSIKSSAGPFGTPKKPTPPRISINTSPARKLYLVDSPRSPAKSVAGAIIDEPTARKGSVGVNLRPRSEALDEGNAANGNRHTRTEENIAGYPMDFFDSDSSDIEAGVLKRYDRGHAEKPNQPHPFQSSVASMNCEHEKVNEHDWEKEHVGLGLDMHSYEAAQQQEDATRLTFENHSSFDLPQPVKSVDQPSFLDETPDHVTRGVSATLENLLPSSEAWIPSQELPIALDTGISSQPWNSTNSKDATDKRILKLYQMTLDVLTRETPRHSQPEPFYFDPATFDNYSHNANHESQRPFEHAYEPNRDSNLTSAHENYNPKNDQVFTISKPRVLSSVSQVTTPYVLASDTQPRGEKNRTISSPPVVERVNGSHVYIESPTAEVRGAEDRQFFPPEVLTPFPRTVSAPEATMRNATNSPGHGLLGRSFPAPLSCAPQRHSFRPSTHASHLSFNTMHSSAIELLVILRRRAASDNCRTTYITIPHEVHVANPKSPSAMGKNEKHFLSLDFDDCLLLKQLRYQYYHSLLGDSTLKRFLERFGRARTIRRIRIVNPNTPQQGENLQRPDKGIRSVDANNVAEKELIRLFRKPRIGKGKYQWVRWAQRTITPSFPKSQNPLPRSDTETKPSNQDQNSKQVSSTFKPADHPAQLEAGTVQEVAFELIEGWSCWRISIAFVLVILASVAICLCWVFLGPDLASTADSSGNRKDQGFEKFAISMERSARIVPACLMGVVLFLIGNAGVGVWLWLSYLVM